MKDQTETGYLCDATQFFIIKYVFDLVSFLVFTEKSSHT